MQNSKIHRASLVTHGVKNPPAMQETGVQSLGQEDPLEKEMATHSSILAWKLSTDRGAWWATVPGVTRVRHNLAIKALENIDQCGQKSRQEMGQQGKWAVTATVYRVTFQGHENVLKSMTVIVPQLCKYNSNWIIHLSGWIVWYLKHTSIKLI